MRSFLKKLFPVLLGAGLSQVNVFIGSFFSSFLKDGSMSCLYYADRFVQLPIALFGVSMGLVLLPEIAAKVASGAKAELGKIQRNSLLFSMRLTLPTVVLLLYLANCLVSLIYGHGKFDERAIYDTTAIVRISTLGLPALIVARVMSAIFFARKDSTTPLLAAAAAVATNLILCCVLAEPFQVSGIAMASSAAGVVDMLFMFYRSRKWFQIDKTFSLALTRIVVSSIVMGAGVYLLCSDTICSFKLNEIYLVCSSCAGGFALYAVMLLLMKDEVVVSCFDKIRRSKR
jgi:putative peptidoglycan lipid II flippase